MSLTALERPAAGEADGALVLFHGRGADEHDLFPLLDALDPERRLQGYTPRGPLALPPGGAHWYVVPRVGYPDPDSFRVGYDAAAEWLDALPFPAERIVIGGFSQGAVMSYALGLGKGRPRPAALLALSGFIPTVEGWEPDLEPPFPPIAIVHGVYDPVIPFGFSRAARAALEEAGAEPLYRELPIEHWIDPSVLPGLREAVSAVGSASLRHSRRSEP
jgi:phospholipase/carboxylesterase